VVLRRIPHQFDDFGVAAGADLNRFPLSAVPQLVLSRYVPRDRLRHRVLRRQQHTSRFADRFSRHRRVEFHE